jgi:hypothetical protein
MSATNTNATTFLTSSLVVSTCTRLRVHRRQPDDRGGAIWAHTVAGFVDTRSMTRSVDLRAKWLIPMPRRIRAQFEWNGHMQDVLREDDVGDQFGADVAKLNNRRGGTLRVGLVATYLCAMAKKTWEDLDFRRVVGALPIGFRSCLLGGEPCASLASPIQSAECRLGRSQDHGEGRSWRAT